MIAVKVKGVGLDQGHNPLLLLIDQEESLVLPIVIGFSEAQSIALKLEGHLFPTPTTHDLLTLICQKLGATISKIVVNDFSDETYYAQIFLEHKGEEIVLDARPSDGVVLALTSGAPLYITDEVAKQSLPLQQLVQETLDFYQDSDDNILH